MRTIKETVALVSSNLLVSLPYFVTYAHQSSDKLLARDVRQAFDLQQTEKIVLVTDTFFDVNGVALTIRKIIREAEQRGIDLTVATCLSEAERAEKLADPEVADLVARGRLEIFPSIVSLDLARVPRAADPRDAVPRVPALRAGGRLHEDADLDAGHDRRDGAAGREAARARDRRRPTTRASRSTSRSTRAT